MTAANEFVSEEGVGCWRNLFSNIGLAVSDFAAQKKVFFLAARAADRRHHLGEGNRYTSDCGPRTLCRPRCSPRRPPSCRPRNGRRSPRTTNTGSRPSRRSRKRSRPNVPDIQWVAEQWPPQGKIDAGAVPEAIDAAKPDAILNVEFGPDLVKLVREGNTRGISGPLGRELPHRRARISRPAEDETPVGWIVTGYPWDDINNRRPRSLPQGVSGQIQRLSPPRLRRWLSMMQAIADISPRPNRPTPTSSIAAAEGIEWTRPSAR